MCKISVVIPAFNAEAYIEESIESILKQTVKVNEIIVVDDGSMDRTRDIVKNIQNKHPEVFLYTQENAGASAARNIGISKATGNWILLLDADDQCAETLVKNYLGKIQDDNYVAVYTDFIQINESSGIISGVLAGQELNGNDGFCKMLIRNPIISPSGSLVKKSVFEEINGFDIKLNYGEDVDFWLQLLDNGFNIGHIAEPLIYIRRHNSNTTANIQITNVGEKNLLNKFSIPTIREKIYSRECPLEDNHLDFANLLIRSDKWKEADKLLRSIHIEYNNDRYINFLFLQSIIAINFKEFKLAMKFNEEILKKKPQHGAAMNNLAVLYSFDRNMELAKELLNKALRQNANYLDAQHNLAILSNEQVENNRLKFTSRELRETLLHYQ
ncbi:glycosyltransferase [Psychrobacillus sp. PGGUH221]|uniref:glycosyltransferase n=1 Tax=Psychrobacillus sp. PGGUH221 TaxID=3020058 RepID=UPI0035C74796